MSSADSYGDLELDPAILNELAVIESNLTSGPVDRSERADPDSDDYLFDPTLNDIIVQHLDKLDAVEDYKGTPKPSPSKTSDSPSINLAITNRQALCGDDVFPGSSSGKFLPPSSPRDHPEIPSSSGARPQTPRHSIGYESYHAKSDCKWRAGKRKGRELDEGEDEEGVMGMRRRPGKRGRGQTSLSRSHKKRPSLHVLQHTKATADMRGPRIDSDSDDPIDFLRSES